MIKPKPKVQNIPFQQDWILYEDEDILVVNKPSGLLSVPGRNIDPKANLIAQLMIYYPDALTVHRLDMDTSGVMVFARNKLAQQHLNQQFEKRSTQKIYHALCYGKPSQSEGIIHLPMRCDWENRPLQIIDFIHGKSATTEWEITHQWENHCLITLKPITGRSHQLRLHLKMLGHPILGDNLYADNHSLKQAQRLLLHAAELTFQHPKTLSTLTFKHAASFN